MEHHANVFLTNLAMVLCVAAVTTVVFQRLRQPVVLGYILPGLLVRPPVPFPLLAALPTISAGSLSASQLGMAAARLGVFLAVVVGAGLLLIPRLVRGILRLDRPETTTVACIGICFALSLLAQQFGYSVALGAFIAGSLVAESGEGARIEHLLEPVRDLFAAVFFVSVGMLIDPALVRANWIPILVLSGVVVAGRMIGVSIPAFLTGAGVRTSIAASMSLARIGEFSFLIAQLGVATGAVRDFLYPVAVSVSAVTALTTPWMIRASGPFSAWVDRKLPHALQTFVALYGSWIDGLRAPGPRRTRAQRIVRLLLVDAALGAAVVFLASRFFADAAIWLRTRAGLGAIAAEIVAMAVAIALSAPFLVGIVRLVGALALALATQALPEGAPGRVDLAAAPRRALIVSLQLVAAVALGLPLLAVP